MTLKGQTRDPNTLRAQYLENSGPLTPRGKSQSKQTWRPTKSQVAQTLITTSSEIAPTAESKLSSFVEQFSEPTPDAQIAMVSLFPARIVESNAPIVNATIRNVPAGC